jgi:hypothetical protein
VIRVRCTFCGQHHVWSDMKLVYDGLDPRLHPYGCEMRNNEHGGSICIPIGVLFAARHVERAVPRLVSIQEG